MMIKKFSFIFLLLQVAVFCRLEAQEVTKDDTLIIAEIYILGNDKTQDYIIKRELQLQKGDTVKASELEKIFLKDQQRIYNTLLFTNVEVTALRTNTAETNILVRVSERWYIWPGIIFKLADRNFTEWWVNQDRDLDRVNYGARLLHFNMFGRNERLRVIAQFGFTKLFELGYSIPYFDKSRKQGLSFLGYYFDNKTVAVASENNRQVFLRSDNTLRNYYGATATYTYRPSFYYYHGLSVGYRKQEISQELLDRRPDYFGTGDLNQSYLVTSYNFRYDNRDNNAYPLSGTYLGASIAHSGILRANELNQTELKFYAAGYQPLGKDFFVAGSLTGYHLFNKTTPYSQIVGLGYQPDFVRGYERYVVEGQTYLLQRGSIKKRLINWKWNVDKYSPLDEFNEIPVELYLSANFDSGWADDRTRNVSNRLLANQYIYGYGLGLELRTIYDTVIRLEYSRNKIGTGGLFLNFRSAI